MSTGRVIPFVFDEAARGNWMPAIAAAVVTVGVLLLVAFFLWIMDRML